MPESRRDLFDRVLRYQNELISFFAGGERFDDLAYGKMRQNLLYNPAYENLAPGFLRKSRDTGSLWSFAKGVDPSWEPRRTYLREQFEPLLDYLENGRPLQPVDSFDASAWTGITSGLQRVKALRALIPLAQASVDSLISALETSNHNGAPPLDDAV